MRLIKTDDGALIKPEDGYEVKQTVTRSGAVNWIWGWRWNRNEGRWGKQCCQHLFRGYEWIEVEESELPTVKRIDAE